MLLLLPYIEQDNVYRNWDLSLNSYFQQPASVREVPQKLYRCPTRRGGRPELSLAHPRGVGWDDTDPSNPSRGHVPGITSDYKGSAQFNTFHGVFADGSAQFRRDPISFLWITDGLSNTLLVGEGHIQQNHPLLGMRRICDGAIYNGRFSCVSYRPGFDGPIARDRFFPQRGIFGSWHPGICQFALCDGSVRALAVSIDQVNLQRLGVRDDGEVITVDF